MQRRNTISSLMGRRLSSTEKGSEWKYENKTHFAEKGNARNACFYNTTMYHHVTFQNSVFCFAMGRVWVGALVGGRNGLAERDVMGGFCAGWSLCHHIHILLRDVRGGGRAMDGATAG